MRIFFYLDDVNEQKHYLEDTLDSVIELLPPMVNYNSRLEILSMLHEYGLYPHSARIDDIKALVGPGCTDEQLDILQGVIEYIRIKSMITNYLDCFIRHAILNEEAVNSKPEYYVECVLDGNVWKLPNKRPIPYAPEILSVVKIQEVTAWEQ